MIPLDHPAVRHLAAERMFLVWFTHGLMRAYWAQVQAQCPQAASWEQTPPYGKDVQLGAQARLLCDMQREDTRDAWVRWGIARDTAIYDEAEAARWRAACAERGLDLTAVLGDARRQWQIQEHREIRAKWNALRDTPDELEAAVVAALETT